MPTCYAVILLLFRTKYTCFDTVRCDPCSLTTVKARTLATEFSLAEGDTTPRLFIIASQEEPFLACDACLCSLPRCGRGWKAAFRRRDRQEHARRICTFEQNNLASAVGGNVRPIVDRLLSTLFRCRHKSSEDSIISSNLAQSPRPAVLG